MAVDWTREENTVVVSEYLTMLEQELSKQAYVKSAANQRVQQLTRRSKGSVEFKFANVSAALRDIHAPYIDGYKPRGNYQADLARALDDALSSRPQLVELMRSEVTDGAMPRVDIQWDVAEPPEVSFTASRRRPTPLHTDFVALEAANRQLGLAGELLVLDRERLRLRKAGRPDLAEAVRHVSVEDGDGAGFDIQSWTVDEHPRHIEVKTTRRGITWPMIVSRNEVEVSRDLWDSYVLARVYHFRRPRVGLYELQGSVDETCVLEPDTWRALPRGA
ncbi:DUF3883 domain-containing protein [Tessaracoccus lubricantis]|uniref:DUF3883 domain-containing protein n=1 Tax=Tessaracoccus lubricantis TaxID=545543 RepID=A0ABP9F457_9ACTN